MEKTPSFEAIEQEISNILDLNDEDLDEETRARVENYLEQLAQQEADKIDGFAFFAKKAAAQADFLKEESKKLAAKAKALENKLDWIKGYYINVMQKNSLQKLKGNSYTVSIRLSDSVFMREGKEIPERFQRVKTLVEPDKVALKEALKAGEELECACLIKKPSLQIR